MIQIFTPNQETVFQDSIKTYGEESQLDQVQEEAIELALAIRKYKRAQKNHSYNDQDLAKRKTELISEIADVIIMTQQCRLIFDDTLIQAEIGRKLDRQMQRINNRMQNNKF